MQKPIVGPEGNAKWTISHGCGGHNGVCDMIEPIGIANLVPYAVLSLALACQIVSLFYSQVMMDIW
jgi:hypothetical protein